jgi:hypothetical protein
VGVKNYFRDIYTEKKIQNTGGEQSGEATHQATK